MFTKTLAMLALAGITVGHMHIYYPPTLKGDNNPFTQGDADPLLNYNYGCCGKEPPGPCKGHLGLLDTDEGRPVATWAPGQKVNFTLSGKAIDTPIENPQGGTHDGGSCQAGFSVDKGKTFKVAATWQGNCPLRGEAATPDIQTFDFTVPADTPAGERVLFAWTWINRENEFNMGCSSVTISGNMNTEQPEQPKSPPSSNAPSATPKPSTAPSKSPKEQPSKTQPVQVQPTGSAQYTLEGCSCSCPYQSWTPACECYNCKSPAIKRHLVERKALELHKRHIQNAQKLNAPNRRAEAMAFNSRPDMLIDVNYAGAKCQSDLNHDAEFEYPNPGPNVIDGDGAYALKPPTC